MNPGDATRPGRESETATALVERFPTLRKLTPADRKRGQIPYLQQTTTSDCGAACLGMVLAYHGKQLGLGEVREVMGVGRDGANALTLLNAANWYGLRGRGVQIEELDDLQFLPKGSILHWQFNHFVVFDELTSGGATIVDPAGGRRRISNDELRRAITGVALTFEPSEDFEKSDDRPIGVWRYVRQILTQSGLLTRIMVISVLVQILALAGPLFTGLLVDRVVPREDYHLLLVLSLGLVMVVIFNFLSSLIRAHLMLHLRTQLDAKITLEFLDHLIDLPFAFFQRRSAGDLMMRLNSNATIRETLTSGALSGIIDGVLVSVYLGLLLAVHLKMTALVLILALLRIGVFLVTRRRYRELMSETLQTQASSRGYQVQMLAGIETLKTMGAERRAIEHWSGLFVDELNVALARGRLSAIVDSVLGILANASPFLILVYGGSLVLGGEMSLGTMLAVNALAVSFLGPVSSLVETALQFQLTGSYIDRINDVLETPREENRQEVQQADELRGAISLDNVSFRYSPTTPMVVKDVSVAVEPGSFVALVGASGAGKTTLANLMLGLYRPSSGTICYDGVSLETLQLGSVRRQLGIVSQQPYLFGASIRNNIALVDPGLPLSRVVEAAELAQIHDDIMAMPMAYDSVVADGGASLSGGQRQRIALARALVHRPAILLLDEATSNLDALTESRVHEELSRLRCTRIVIAHRLSTVKRADVILVMEEGRMIERGTHAELVSKDTYYSRLVAAQLEDDDGGSSTST